MRFKAIGVGVLAVVAVMAMVFLPREEERRVRARVTGAAESLSGRAGEGDIDRLARLAGFRNGLAPDVVVEAEPGGPSIRGRDAVAAAASQFAAAGGSQQISVSDLAVAFNDTRSRATVTAVVHLLSAATAGPVSAHDGELVRLELVKAGDEWLITRAVPDPALAH